jgi:hypothetical protein
MGNDYAELKMDTKLICIFYPTLAPRHKCPAAMIVKSKGASNESCYLSDKKNEIIS